MTTNRDKWVPYDDKFSKIDRSFYDYCKLIMSSNGYQYHNWDHIDACYFWLNAFGFPYSSALDYAVLGHDLIQDSREYNKIKSADIVESRLKHIDVSSEIIENTKRHILSTKTHVLDDDLLSMPMIIADLGDFLHVHKVAGNFAKLYDENKSFRFTPDMDYFNNSNKYLKELKNTMYENAVNCHSQYNMTFIKIGEGIDMAMTLNNKALMDLV